MPDVMDASGAFKSNNEVLSERVKICLKLQELDNDNYKEYSDEIEEIVTSLAIAKASSKIGSGRLFIDTAGVLKLKREHFYDMFQKYRSLPADPTTEDKWIQYDETGEKFLPSSEKDQLLVTIFEELTQEFIQNRDYGLDGNLSLEVRHGQLETLFWVPLEKLHLVTKKDESGVYSKNFFWRSKYELVKPEYTNEIDRALSQFSGDVDETIEVLKKEWFVAKARTGNFGFSLDKEDLPYINSRVANITNYDLFISTMSEIILEITEENIRLLRSKISNDVPAMFDAVFLDLGEKLAVVKQQFVLADLDSSIALGRNEIHKSVDELVGLIDFINKHNSPNFSISIPLNLSIEAFKTTYSHKKVHFDVLCDETPEFAGRYFHDFVRIFLTLFDNVVRHATSHDLLPTIAIKVEFDAETLKIVTKNKIDNDKDVGSLSAILEEIRNKLKDKSYSDTVNKEGKTGIYKIDKILTASMLCDHEIEFDIADLGEFHLNITLNVARLLA